MSTSELTEKCYKTPVTDLLAVIPADHVIQFVADGVWHNCPIGRIAGEAITELQRLTDRNAEMETLVAERDALREAARLGGAFMKWSISQNHCDCESDHICGMNERKRELEQIKAALALSTQEKPNAD